MNTLVFGKGFLGSAFERAGYKTVSLRECESLWDLDGFKEADYIINTVAFTNTKAAQNIDNWPEVFDTNSTFPCKLQEVCEKWGKKFIHISTGCVYGNNNYLPDEESGCLPVGVYAHSKLVADEYLKNKALILRPRLLYGTFSHPKNLFDRLSKFDSFFNILNSVTSVEAIVESIPFLKDEIGIFNIDSDVVSMYEIANIMEIKAELNHSPIRGYPNIIMQNQKDRKSVV